VLANQFNLGHVSNASALWLGMRPADIFVFVFLPPFLLDLAVRIDWYMLKKVGGSQCCCLACSRGSQQRHLLEHRAVCCSVRACPCR
jgi:hypothetical protein